LGEKAVTVFSPEKTAEACQILQQHFMENGIDPPNAIYACECMIANICRTSDLPYEQYVKICEEATKNYRFLWGN